MFKTCILEHNKEKEREGKYVTKSEHIIIAKSISFMLRMESKNDQEY